MLPKVLQRQEQGPSSCFGYEGIHDSRPRHDDTTKHRPDSGDRTTANFFRRWLANGRFAVHHSTIPRPRGESPADVFQETPFLNTQDSVETAFELRWARRFCPTTRPRKLTPRDPLGLFQNYQDATTAEEKAKVLQLPPAARGPEPGARGSASSSATAPTSANSTYNNNYFDKRRSSATQFLLLFERPPRSIHVADASRRPMGVEHALQLQTASSRGSDQPEIGGRPSTMGVGSAFRRQYVSQVAEGPSPVFRASISPGTSANGLHQRGTVRSTPTTVGVHADQVRPAARNSIRTGFEYRVLPGVGSVQEQCADRDSSPFRVGLDQGARWTTPRPSSGKHRAIRWGGSPVWVCPIPAAFTRQSGLHRAVRIVGACSCRTIGK